MLNKELSPLTYQQQKIIHFLLLMKTETEDTEYVFTVDEHGDATLVYYYGQKQDIIVPKKISGYPVKYIEGTCYNYNTNIQSVTMHDNILEIR